MRIGVTSIAVAATGDDNQLLGRVKRIMNVKTTNFNYGQRLFAFIFIAFLLISIAWLSPDQHINNANHHNEKTAPKSDTREKNSYAIDNGKKILVTEKNTAISTPAPKTITVSPNVISDRNTLNTITSKHAYISLSLPAAPKALLPPSPPAPPAPAFLYDPHRQGEILYHFEMPGFPVPQITEEDFLTPYGLPFTPGADWIIIQDNIRKQLPANGIAPQKKRAEQLLLLNEKLRIFDTASAKSLSSLLEKAREQRMLSNRQLELILQQDLRMLHLRQKESSAGDRATEMKSHAENERSMDGDVQKQQRIRKKVDSPSLWIYNDQKKKFTSDREEWQVCTDNVGNLQGKMPVYDIENAQSTTLKVIPWPGDIPVAAAKTGFTSGKVYASQTTYAVDNDEENRFGKKLLITDDSDSGMLIITIL